MAASDHLEPKLFHGTSTWMPVGTVIHARKDVYYPKSPAAYATTDLDEAKEYSLVSRGRSRQKAAENKEPYQPPLFSPVYEVAHMSGHSDPESRIERTTPNAALTFRRDPEGFRITKLAGYSYYND